MTLITLTAKRVGSSVHVFNQDGSLKAKFPNTGYRPTKATKTLTLNCFKYNLQFID